MGAENTKFHAVNITNPNTPPDGIHITKNVVNRLETAAKDAEADKRCSCCLGGDTKHQTSTIDANVNTPDLSKEDLASITEKVDKILGKPLVWSKEVQDEIKKLRNKVLQCYNLNTAKPLLCANVAASFNQYVLTEQTKLLYNTRLEEESKLEMQEKEANAKEVKKSFEKGNNARKKGMRGWLSETKDMFNRDEHQKLMSEIKKREEDLKKREDLLRKREEELLFKSEKLKRTIETKDCEAAIIQNISEEFQKLSDGPRGAP